MTVKMISAADDMPTHVQERDLEEYESEDLVSDDDTLNQEISIAMSFGGKDSRKMMNRLRQMSGLNLTDSVEERRDAERKAIDAIARQRIANEPQYEDIPVLRRPRAVPSNARLLAEMIGVGPEAVRWDRVIQSIPKPSLFKMVKNAREAINPQSEWDYLVGSLEPRHPSCMRPHRNAAYFPESGRRSPAPLGLKMVPKENNLPAAAEWMDKAETDQLTNRRTRCELTGNTLVEQGYRAGLAYWRLVPDFHGMGIEAAREMVNVAAILAGIMPGEIKGEIPQIAKDLASDGNAWCGLALATKHPIFYSVAKSMEKFRDSEFWDVEDETNFRNLQEWHTAVCEEANASAA